MTKYILRYCANPKMTLPVPTNNSKNKILSLLRYCKVKISSFTHTYRVIANIHKYFQILKKFNFPQKCLT